MEKEDILNYISNKIDGPYLEDEELEIMTHTNKGKTIMYIDLCKEENRDGADVPVSHHSFKITIEDYEEKY